MNITLFLLALIPIFWLIVSLGALKIPGHIACPVALATSLLIAVTAFKSTPAVAFSGALEGIVMGLWPIVFIIIAAVFTYNITVESGGMDIIKKQMVSVTTDRRILVLILAWGFGGFLESIAGFGTAVAIPAGILAGLGFDPIKAAVLCLIANTTPTAFGAIGLPVTTLAQVSGLEPHELAYTISLQLFPLILIIPFILVKLTGKEKEDDKGIFLITLCSGLAYALPQILVTKFIGAELPSIIGSLLSMFVTILMAKKREQKLNGKKTKRDVSNKEIFRAWLPFILVFLLIIGSSSLIPPIHKALNSVSTSVPIYKGEGASLYTFKWLACPGTLMIVAAIIGGLLQRLSLKQIFSVLGKTVSQMGTTVITVSTIVALAKVMGYSGMIHVIADVLVAATGSFYTFVAPVIGALGTFVTGSDTSANVLFGQLQVDAANSIGANPFWIAAANMSGATAGKMISPQSIAVATAATGLQGSEGKILNATLKVCLGYVVIIGIVVYFGAPIFL